MNDFLTALEQDSIETDIIQEIKPSNEKRTVKAIDLFEIINNPESYPVGSFIDLTLTKKENDINRVKYEQSLQE
jgi:hypothetical protein